MAIYRHPLEHSKFVVEYGWAGPTYYKAPIQVQLVEKFDKPEGGTDYKIVEDLGEITYDKEKAKEGYTFKSKAGEITLKWERKFWIIEKIVVLINGKEVKGNEVIKFATPQGEIGEVS